MKKAWTSLLLAAYPIYQMISWIWVFNKYQPGSQEIRVNHYLEFHPFISEASLTLWAFISIALLIGAITILLKSDLLSSSIMSKKIIGLLLLLLYTGLTLLNIWGML